MNWTDNQPRHVYVIESAETGHVKIGVAEDVFEQLKDLQSASPVPLTLYNYLRAASRSEAMVLERLCHDALQSVRTHGEWFLIQPRVAWVTLNSVIDRFNDMVKDAA